MARRFARAAKRRATTLVRALYGNPPEDRSTATETAARVRARPVSRIRRPRERINRVSGGLAPEFQTFPVSRWRAAGKRRGRGVRVAGARDGTKVSVCIKPREPGGYRLSVRDCRRGVCYAGCAARGYVPCLASHDSNSTQTLLSASASPLSLVALRQPAYSLPSRPRTATMVFKLHRPSTQYRLTFGPRGRPSSRLIRGRSHREFQSPGLLHPSPFLGRSSSDRPTEIVSEPLPILSSFVRVAVSLLLCLSRARSRRKCVIP